MNARSQKKHLVAANWKMNGSRTGSADLLQSLVDKLGTGRAEVDLVICPPSILIPLSEQSLRDSALALGAQNLYPEPSGAFTGEISPPMLTEYSVKYVIVGHSERRRTFGETNELVAVKFKAAQEHSMIPILCVGETLEERESGSTRDVVGAQLGTVLAGSGIHAFAAAVVAYEPVWAIGTGKTASAEQAQEVHSFIRSTLAEQDPNIASKLRIIYGGSVKSANAEQLFAQADIDGGLIGGASLDAEEFTKICESLP